MSGVAAMQRRRARSSIVAVPIGVSKAPAGTMATPSKSTKWDGPTRTASVGRMRAELTVGETRDRTGVHEPGVRAHQGDDA